MDRRTLLAKTCTAGIASIPFVGTSVASPDPVLRGRIAHPDNRPAAGHQIDLTERIFYQDGSIDREFRSIMLDERGRIEHEFDYEDAKYVTGHFAFYSQDERGRSTTLFNGTPDLHWLGRFDTRDRKTLNLGNVRLPEGHLLNVRAVNKDGEPLDGVYIRVASCSDEDCWSWFGTGTTPVNDDGLFVNWHTQEPGIEMNGPVYVNVYDHYSWDGGEKLTETELQVTEEEEVELTIDV